MRTLHHSLYAERFSQGLLGQYRLRLTALHRPTCFHDQHAVSIPGGQIQVMQYSEHRASTPHPDPCQIQHLLLLGQVQG